MVKLLKIILYLLVKIPSDLIRELLFRVPVLYQGPIAFIHWGVKWGWLLFGAFVQLCQSTYFFCTWIYMLMRSTGQLFLPWSDIHLLFYEAFGYEVTSVLTPETLPIPHRLKCIKEFWLTLATFPAWFWVFGVFHWCFCPNVFFICDWEVVNRSSKALFRVVPLTPEMFLVMLYRRIGSPNGQSPYSWGDVPKILVSLIREFFIYYFWGIDSVVKWFDYAYFRVPPLHLVLLMVRFFFWGVFVWGFVIFLIYSCFNMVGIKLIN